MRIWNSFFTYEHPWDTVVQAVWRKYPNPYNPCVVGLDVIDRKVDRKTGILRSHRLMQTKWWFSDYLPDFLLRYLGMDKINLCYGSEHSEVDPRLKTLTVKTRNLTLCSFISIEETITYRPHESDKNKTVFESENVVNAHGVPLRSYLENIVIDGIEKNANKGKAAMESVIAKINQEKEEVLRNVENVLHGTTLKNTL